MAYSNLKQLGLAAVIGVAFTNPTFADCKPREEMFMACDFSNGKAVEVCTDGNFVRYTFGPQGGTPELALRLAFQEGAEAVPWPGVGSAVWDAIRLTNNDIVYEVYGGFERYMDGEKIPDVLPDRRFGGIVVEDFDGTELAHLQCLPGTVDYGF